MHGPAQHRGVPDLWGHRILPWGSDAAGTCGSRPEGRMAEKNGEGAGRYWSDLADSLAEPHHPLASGRFAGNRGKVYRNRTECPDSDCRTRDGQKTLPFPNAGSDTDGRQCGGGCACSYFRRIVRARQQVAHRSARCGQRRDSRPARGGVKSRTDGVGLMPDSTEAIVLGAVEEVPADELDRKLLDAFAGRVVRKDLVKKVKVGFNIPVYVLEYLLGKFCSTYDRKEIENGLAQVKETIQERIVRADHRELIKARLQKQGSLKLIDHCVVTFDEKDQGGKYWARLSTGGLDYVHIDPDLVHKNERLLTGGIWANIELTYDETLIHRGTHRPFVLQRLAPIQIAAARLSEFVEGRKRFSRDEWVDVLIRTMGYEPTNADFSPRRKWLYLMRLIPMVEKNYNLVELGPRGTGKSYIYRELSPYVILISGGQVTVPKLFVSNAPPYDPGVVTRYDTFACDERARPQFNKAEDKQIYKDYMEMGSFSRGSAKGTVQAEASFVFNGNLEGDVETIARTSHLFLPFPDAVRNDMAFHDRWHGYLPGWEMPKLQPGYFGSHMGFIADYIAEIFHNELRPKSYADAYDRYFHLGSHIEERDRKAIAKTVSGLVKLLHPDGECSRTEVEEYLTFAIEMRRRIKEQLRRMGGLEYARVNLSYIAKDT